MKLNRPGLSPGLYAITPNILSIEVLVAQLESLLQGGVNLVQYRSQNTTYHIRLATGHALHSLCRQYQVPLIINDDVKLAATLQAEGVHLGQQDLDILRARQLLGPQAIIGVTCHDSLSLAENAACHGANYLSFGRFFPSTTKPEAPFAPLSILKQAKQAFNLPIVAIGGITLNNAPAVLKAGADSLAVIADLFTAANIRQHAAQFTEIIQTHHAGQGT